MHSTRSSSIGSSAIEMRFGLSLPNNQGVAHVGELVELAQYAEACGIASVWVSEHLFHASYVADRLGSRPYHEPLTILGAVAASTKRVRLGTSVLVLPFHHPVRLAKTLASLDDLSQGRVTLGVGVAVTEDEFRNLGVPFHKRGAIADEMLAAMRSLWTEDVPTHDGKHFAFSGLRFEPKPIQKPMPIWIGGASERAFRRLAAWGNGWHPLSVSATELAEGIARCRAAFAEHGRKDEHFDVAPRLMLEFMDEPWERPVDQRRTCRGTASEIVEILRAYARAGATEVILDANSRDLDAVHRMLERLFSEITPELD
jgi:probable F420-dependent oxidoreductase